MRTRHFLWALLWLALGAQAADRPNILVIMSDDVGYWNIGAYSHGMMVPTPNIDRIAAKASCSPTTTRTRAHRRARRLHHRAAADPHRPDDRRPAGLDRSASSGRDPRWPRC
jgi:hypothetical protein